MPKPRRSWKQDGTAMPYSFKSKKGDGSFVEKGTPIVTLCYADLVYLAGKPDSEKDVYNVKGQAKDELLKRTRLNKAVKDVQKTIDFFSGRKGLLKLVASL